MADEEELSDAQLREQLKKHGENPGPITATTRGLYLKKLNRIKSGESNSSPYSKKGKNRRSIATSTPSRNKSKLSGFSSGEDEFPVKKSALVDLSSGSARRRSAFPRVTQAKEENDSDSPRVVFVENRGPKPVGRRRSLPRTQVRETKSLDTLPGGADSAISPSVSYVNDEDVYLIESRASSSHRKNSFEYEESERVETKKRATTTPPKISVQDNITTRRRHVQNDQVDSAASNKLTKEILQDNGQDDDEELDFAFVSSSSFLKNWRGPAFFMFVAVLLMCLVGSYMSLQSNRISELPALPDLKTDKAHQKVDKEKVFKVLRCLHEKLTQSAGEKECGYPDVKITMNGGEIKDFSAKCLTTFEEKLVDFKKLGVEVVKMALEENYAEYFSAVDKREDKKSFKENCLSQVTFSSKKPVKPFSCKLKQAIRMLSTYVILIVLGFTVVIATYSVLKERWTMDDEDTRLMFVYVERIIETLRRHNEACQHDKELPAYLPIPHVRDMLIPPRDRKKRSRAWKKAVDFLSSTDSRIRVETQRISGEDFEVWRWIGVITPEKKVRGANNHLGPEEERGKFWQGPAFDKLEKVVRMPIITPTPCLKIRYLHGGPNEKEEEGWDYQVRDALVEKCNEGGAKILHIYVDIKSPEGCVYVKCDSLDSAGKAFRSVYGNWFDGRLVIVKFVTVARYHQRFPDSLTCVQPLEVSGEFQSSLGCNNPSAEVKIAKKL